MTKIIIGFTFYNELNMLETHLTELYDYVDIFILVEANVTFTGIPKPFYFEQNKDRYAKFLDKIIHIKVIDMPNTRNAWDNEVFQRNCITRGLHKISGLSPSDILVICDVDEIISNTTPDQLRKRDFDIDTHPSIIPMNYYFYNFTCKAANPWLFVKAIKLGKLIASKKTCHQVRVHNIYSEIIPDTGGWHLSYFGDKEYIKNKLRSFSHTEYSKGKYIDDTYIEDMITQCKSLFPPPDIYHFSKVDENTQEKPELWSILIAKTPFN
jgi:hypothetical protein